MAVCRECGAEVRDLDWHLRAVDVTYACPACGWEVPHEYELEKDGELTYNCPTCGREWWYLQIRSVVDMHGRSAF